MSQIFSQGTEVEQEARESTDCPDFWHLLGGRSFPASAFRFSFTLISIPEGNKRDYLWSVRTTVPLKSKLSVASSFLRDEIRVSREGGNLLLSGTVHSLFSKIQRFAANECSHDIAYFTDLRAFTVVKGCLQEILGSWFVFSGSKFSQTYGYKSLYYITISKCRKGKSYVGLEDLKFIYLFIYLFF